MIDAAERAAMEETVRAAIADALATAGEGGRRRCGPRAARMAGDARRRAGRRHRHRVRRARRHERDGDGARRRARVGARQGAARRPRRPAPALRRVGPAGTNRRGATSTRRASRRLAPPRAGELLVVCGTASEPWARRRSDGGRGGAARCTGSIPTPAFARGPRAGQRGGRHAPRSRRVAIGRRPRPARGRAPDRRRQPSHAGPRAHPRAGAGAVRSSDRALPGRAPPARGRAGGGGGPRGDARRGPGGAEPRHGGPREGRRRTHGAHGAPRTASRCSPASASPRSIRSTAS